jgi:hypothetical protein
LTKFSYDQFEAILDGLMMNGAKVPLILLPLFWVYQTAMLAVIIVGMMLAGMCALIGIFFSGLVALFLMTCGLGG